MEVNTNKKIGNTSEKPVFCHNAEKGGGGGNGRNGKIQEGC